MDELEGVKEYLRIESDDTESDKELLELIDGAKVYMERTTRKKYNGEDSLMRQALRLLVTHWYTNRQIEGKQAVTGEFAHTFTAILNNIALSDFYEPIDKDKVTAE